MDMEQWLAALAEEIGTDDFVFDNNAIHTVLDLARDAAHSVTRPAAPLTTFLVGVAVGRGVPLGAVAAKATALAIGIPDEATHNPETPAVDDPPAEGGHPEDLAPDDDSPER